jgi:hypothetical protein
VLRYDDPLPLAGLANKGTAQAVAVNLDIPTNPASPSN